MTNFLLSDIYKFAFLIISFPLFAAEAPWVGKTLAEIPCWGQPGGFGPFDYTVPNKKFLDLVETHHFFPEIEQLALSYKPLMNNLDYTLRAFPNHHRALQSLTKLSIRLKENPKINIERSRYTPVECYFERAINFQPNDPFVRILYAIFLHKNYKHLGALKQYQEAEKLMPENAEIHYNFALLYIDLKRYKEAYKHAAKAYKKGYPLPGLKNKLNRLGYWKNSTD